MKTGLKVFFWVLAVLFVIGMFLPDSKNALCEDHPGGRGITTLDEKFEWVKQCNGGRPAPAATPVPYRSAPTTQLPDGAHDDH